ncbi:MarR family transcriptional regulator [bacterium]|nr:MarR family transcriptional regulator [bacterium]
MDLKKMDELGHLSNRVAADFRAAADQRMQELGMHAPQGMILGILEELGPLSLADMAKLLKYTHPSVLRHIDALEERGLVERTQHPEDRRIKLLTVTRAGKKLVPVLFGILDEINRDALQGVSKKDQQTVIRVLNQVHENLGGLGCPDDIVEQITSNRRNRKPKPTEA